MGCPSKKQTFVTWKSRELRIGMSDSRAATPQYPGVDDPRTLAYAGTPSQWVEDFALFNHGQTSRATPTDG